MAEYKDPETLQRMRVVAHMKFKRKVKCLQLQIDKDSTPENLHRCYDEVNKAYEQLEQAHESYLEQICLTADLESEETFMDDADSLKINVTNSYDKALTKCNQDREADVKKFKLLPEDSQCSSWEIINTVGGNEKQTISLDCHQVREDLKIMFPYLDADDIEEALQDRHGDINETIDRLLTTTIETNIQDNGSKKNINMNHLQECSICCEVYNEDDHRPLVLPCGHTLCKACINNVTSEGWNTVTIHCPICRKYHTINPNQLTTNYIVLDLLQATGNSAQNTERSTSFSPESKVKCSKSEENHKVEVEQDTKRNSSNHKVEIEQETKRNCTTKPDGKSNARSSILKSVGIGVGVVAGGAAAIAAAPVVLTGVGFTSAGIAAGSWAASMMSAAAVANGGAIAAGSTVAILQSAGAVGLGAGLTAGVAAGGAAVGGGVAAGVAKLTGGNTNDTDNEKKEK